MSKMTMSTGFTRRDSLYFINSKKLKQKKKCTSYSSSSSSSSSSSLSSELNDSPHQKKTKKKSSQNKNTKKMYKIAKKTKIERKSSESDHSSDLELKKAVLPLSGYMKDKEELLKQMLRSISVKKLREMLPEILKPLSLDQIKQLCLNQLDGMSDKRINHILNGGLSEEISSSEESICLDEEKTENTEQNFNIKKDKIESVGNDFSSSLQIIDKNDICEGNSNSISFDGKLIDSVNDVKPLEKVERPKECYEIQCYAPEITIDSYEDNFDEGASNENNEIQKENKEENFREDDKTRLEILELEMRARAIKAMLRAQEEKKNAKIYKTELKEENMEHTNNDSIFKNDERIKNKSIQNEYHNNVEIQNLASKNIPVQNLIKNQKIPNKNVNTRKVCITNDKHVKNLNLQTSRILSQRRIVKYNNEPLDKSTKSEPEEDSEITIEI